MFCLKNAIHISICELQLFKRVKIEANHFHSLLIDDTFHLESTLLKIKLGQALAVWGNITGGSCYSVGQAVTSLGNVIGATCPNHFVTTCPNTTFFSNWVIFRKHVQ